MGESKKGENEIKKKTEGQENLSARERDIFFCILCSYHYLFSFFFLPTHAGRTRILFFFSLWLCFVGRENKRRGPSMKDLYLFV